MPSKSLRPCGYPGCTQLGYEHGYCRHHADERERREREQRARYENETRDPRTWDAYNSRAWKRLRDAYRAAHPWCEECLGHGMQIPMDDVHHLVPHGGNYSLLLDPDNLEALCKRCHSRLTRAGG